MSVKINLDHAIPVWEKTPSIIAVWSFGSSMDGTVSPGSDLDIAILFSSSPSLGQLTTIRSDLQEVFNIDAIDLLILNSASCISGMEAVTGKSIFCRDLEKRAEFVSLLARQYEDDMAFLEHSLYLQ